MTVQQLIAKLQGFPPDLSVAISDWNKSRMRPSEDEAEVVVLDCGKYGTEVGFFVRIGSDLPGNTTLTRVPPSS